MSQSALYLSTEGAHGGATGRALRAALNLERRHISLLANALRLDPEPYIADDVYGWERSKWGYPGGVVHALGKLNDAVDTLAGALAASVTALEGGQPAIERPRPPTGIRLLELERHGLRFDARAMDDLSFEGGDFWQRLIDAALLRVALNRRADGEPPLVVIHERVDTPSSTQSAPRPNLPSRERPR